MTELFGIVAVTVMVVAYALEHRGSRYVLLFGIACLGASAYAIMIRSWPFAIVEALWSVIACRRWLRGSAADDATAPSDPRGS